MNLFGITDTSQFGELAIVDTLLKEIETSSDYVIDIGASDGVYASNTYHMFKNGSPGVAIECDPTKFGKLATNYRGLDVNLFRGKATPGNIIGLLSASRCPSMPKYLNLDIDSCDYYVLESILKIYRPSLITAEINETIPPGIDFRVLPSSDVAYFPGSHFYGMSISALGHLCRCYKYDLLGLNYVNAFLMPREKNRKPPVSPKGAYDTGYWQKPDRKQKFPYNADMDALHDMPSGAAMKQIARVFEKYSECYRMRECL